jgi:hypothetical protein
MTTGARTKRPKAAEAKTKNTGLEVGDTGTKIFDGIISEEYNSKLADVRGIAIYDEMRKSDGTVRAAVQAVTLPIRAAEWFVTPASEEGEDVLIHDFVTQALFESPEFTFDDFLRQALLSLPFGVMVFEKVFGTRDVEGSTRIVWEKLAPRLPKSIQKWAIADKSFGITQQKSDGSVAEIPGEKLIVFVHEKEGENWWGVSILRAAYKHWFIKNTIYKIDAIAFERQGLGVPYVKLPEGATESDRSKAETILKNLRANSQAFIIEPHDYEIGFKDMQADKTRDPQNSIAHHNREIMKCVLAQFLELGQSSSSGSGGSRALSEDHSALFLQSIESIARSFASVMNKHIKELVDLNFDDVKEYPKLDFEGITSANVEEIASAYQTLTGSGAVTAQDADETYFRELLGLPELDESGIREKEPVTTEINSNAPDKTQASERGRVKKKPGTFAEAFRPYRKLTFAEGKVNFDALQKKLDELENIFDQQTKDLLTEARHAYMDALTKAALAGDTQAIKDATLKVQGEYARILKNGMQSAYMYGKNNAAKEIGKDAPPNPAEMLRQIDIQAAAIADQQIASIVSESKSAYVQSRNKGESKNVALAAADAAAAAAIADLTDDATGILMSGYINHGRDTVFDRNAADIHGLQRSELMDVTTCNYCLSVDGRIIETDDPFGHNTIFHSNCRGIWVAILKDEEELPKVDGIPKSIRDRFGDVVNDLIQPKNPVTRKDTAARAEADKRKRS